MDSSNILLYTVIGFLVINLMIGLWAGRGVKTVEDYAVGKKKWSTGALVMTFLATILDGGALFRESHSFITIGIVVFIHFFGISISHFIRLIFLSNQVSRFRHCFSIGDFANELYGNKPRILVGFFSAFYSSLVVALQIKALSLIFSEFVGINSIYATLISGFIIAAYTAFGGMRAVVSTDILQFIMIFGTLLIVAFFSIYKSGGLLTVLTGVPKNVLSFSGKDSISIYWALFIMEVVFSYELAEPARFQRVLMCENRSAFKKLFLYSGLGSFVGFGLIFLSTLAVSSTLTHNLGDLNPIIYIVHNLLPAYFKPIVVVGMVAIVFSSGDSWLHSSGTSLTRDFLEPIFKKKVSLKTFKINTFLTGLISIFLAFKGEFIFLNLGSLLSVMAPIVSVPIFFGFLGIKTSGKMFWGSTLSALTSFVMTKAVLTSCSVYGIVISCTCSFIAYMVVHIFENEKIVMVGNPIFGDSVKSITRFISYSDLLLSFRKFVDRKGNQYVVFGALYLITITIPYLFNSSVNTPYVDLIFYFRIIGVGLCSFFITRPIWPKVLRDHTPFIWYAALCYCLPFLSLALTIISNGSLENIISIYVSLLALFLLVEWRSGLIISLIGFLLAIFYTNYQNVSLSSIDNEKISIVLIQSVIAIVLGVSFSRKRDKNSSLLGSKSRLLKLIQTNVVKNTQIAMSLPRREDSQINHTIALPSTKEKLQDIMKTYYGTMSKNLQEDFSQLSKALENEERTKIYHVLDAQKYELSDLLYSCEEALKAAGCEDVTIDLNTKQKTIRCDKASILKMLYKIANDHCKKIYQENLGDDTDLILSIFDTKINYESEDENDSKKLFSRTIDGVAITLLERDITKENDLVKDIYRRALTDPEAIAESRVEDVDMLDVRRGIDAHYGILEEIKDDSDYLTWLSVIPVDVYQIRPETLDLDEPIDDVYNWPAAVELEKKFMTSLVKHANEISISKIDYAISVIKKYHFRQKRKSGEPFYMHPISVAMLLLDTIEKSKGDIHDKLLASKEDILIAVLLHDLLEDTAYSRKALTRNFGSKVCQMVLEVTKITHSKRAAMLSNIQAFQDLINKEPLALCIKLADRLHNLMTIDGHPKVEKRKAVAQETLDFFVPPAEKFGFEKLAQQLREGARYVLEHGKIEGCISLHK